MDFDLFCFFELYYDVIGNLFRYSLLTIVFRSKKNSNGKIIDMAHPKTILLWHIPRQYCYGNFVFTSQNFPNFDCFVPSDCLILLMELKRTTLCF